MNQAKATSALLIFLTSSLVCQAQLSGIDRERAQGMLKNLAVDVKKHYYDPKLHGVDWDAKVAATKAKIDKASSMNMALSNIAALMDSLNDSHTFFVPPSRPFRHDYGNRAEMIGDRCFVTQVRPKTDAEAQGLKPGDEIVELEGYALTAQDFWKMQYVYNLLRPQPSLRLTIRTAAGQEKELRIAAKVRELKLIRDMRGDVDNEFWQMVRDVQNEEYADRIR